jgi:hypothetical protein
MREGIAVKGSRIISLGILDSKGELPLAAEGIKGIFLAAQENFCCDTGIWPDPSPGERTGMAAAKQQFDDRRDFRGMPGINAVQSRIEYGIIERNLTEAMNRDMPDHHKRILLFLPLVLRMSNLRMGIPSLSLV